jgi:hypothetical protein
MWMRLGSWRFGGVCLLQQNDKSDINKGSKALTHWNFISQSDPAR